MQLYGAAYRTATFKFTQQNLKQKNKVLPVWNNISTSETFFEDNMKFYSLHYCAHNYH